MCHDLRSRARSSVCWGLVASVAVAVFAFVSPWQAQAQQAEERQLSAARQQLADIADELRDAEQAQASAEQALEVAEQTLTEIEQVVNEVAAEVERQRAAVRDARRRLEDVERDATELQAAFEERIAKLYMHGPELTFELLLSSEGAEQAVARTVLLEQLAEGDQVDLERLEAARVVVAAERARLAAEQGELEARLADQEVVLAEAEELRGERALAAADARARTDRLAEEHHDLEAEESRLADLVTRAQREERDRVAAARREAAASSTSPRRSPTGGGSGGAATTSGYRWPMCAPVTSEYGPRWGRIHRGIDQGAPTGSAIGAVASGRVISAGWQGGYGNLLLVDHGGVVSAYAHLSRFAVGQGAQVSQGQTVGFVGTTGNSTGPHLHLEFRVNGSAVNPRQYLSGSPC